MSKWLNTIKRKASKAADAVGDAANKAKESVGDAASKAKESVGGALDDAQASIQKKLDKDILDAYLSGAMLLVSSDGEVGDEYGRVTEGLQHSPTLAQFTAGDVTNGMESRLAKLVEDPDSARDRFHKDLSDINADAENAKIVLDALTTYVYDESSEMQDALSGVSQALNITE